MTEELDIFELSYLAQGLRKDHKKPWMDSCQMTLVNESNISSAIDACINSYDKFFALDLETEGLDNRVRYSGDFGCTNDRIVGVCLASSPTVGWYIPLRHIDPNDSSALHKKNVPYSVFDKEFRRLIAAVESGKVSAVFHNAEFDQEFLEYPGCAPYGDWSIPSRWDCTYILISLYDSRRKTKGLKSASKEDLGMEMIELDDLFSEDEKNSPGFKKNFARLDLDREEVPWYGCSDGICTYRLRQKYYPLVVHPTSEDKTPNQKSIYMIEKLCSASTRWMMRNAIGVDRKKVWELITIGQKEWVESVKNVYKEAEAILGRDIKPGYYTHLFDNFQHDNDQLLMDDQIEIARSMGLRYPTPSTNVEKVTGGKLMSFPYTYDINAPAQLGQMFQEMEVPGLIYTEKSNQVQTSKDVLDQIIEDAGDKFPFMNSIKRFREISKALSSYLYPMWYDAEGEMRIPFKAHTADTGRFSTPADKKAVMKGRPALNLQSFPATYDPNRPECMRRLRECVASRNGRKTVAIDFSGVELRIVTNLSLESKWLEQFFKCSSCNRTFTMGDGSATPEPPPIRCPNCGSDKIGDLHTLTALSIFGQDAINKPEWKQLRQMSKATNFALCYGGSGAAVVRATGCDKNEGSRIKMVFDQTYTGLKSFWLKQHKYAREHGYIVTAFGRKYPLPDINNPDGKFRSKAERNAVNGPIQGSSADITKLSMGLIYKEMKARGWDRDKVLMIITMHDELVFEMDPNVMEEAIEVIKSIMNRNQILLGLKWPVPLTSDVEIGDDWSVPYALNDMRAGEVRYKGSKKYKDAAKAAKDGLDWDTLPNFPEDLAKHFRYQTFEGLSEAIKVWVEKKGDLPAASKLTAKNESPSNPGIPGIPRLGPNALLQFEIPELSLDTAYKLGKVLSQCQAGGSKTLKLVFQNEELADWSESPVFVHEEEFLILARAEGLVTC